MESIQFTASFDWMARLKVLFGWKLKVDTVHKPEENKVYINTEFVR
jgi:hypothetical protein